MKRGNKNKKQKYSKKEIDLIEKKIQEDFKEAKREIKQAEKWVIARRKFFIKLGIILALFLIILVINEFAN